MWRIYHGLAELITVETFAPDSDKEEKQVCTSTWMCKYSFLQRILAFANISKQRNGLQWGAVQGEATTCHMPVTAEPRHLWTGWQNTQSAKTAVRQGSWQVPSSSLLMKYLQASGWRRCTRRSMAGGAWQGDRWRCAAWSALQATQPEALKECPRAKRGYL